MSSIIAKGTPTTAAPAVMDALAKTQEDIVMSGMAGRFPESESIDEFADKLFAGVDLVTADDRRWPPGLFGLPERNGKLKDLAHFDATFFGVHPKQANVMDPQMRILMELTYEALVDAGVNPVELRGSRTGVFVGLTFVETEGMIMTDTDKISGYEAIGCCRAMFANRISYSFDFKGPSYVIDTACSSSLTALAEAVTALRAGNCDTAIVAGCNLCLSPLHEMGLFKLTTLCMEGRCASFDAEANGYVRSEGIAVVVLQRRSVARRVYATVTNVRTNTDGNKIQGITYPNGEMQRLLAQETLEEAKLRPQDIVYVEAHGPGTKVGDLQEVSGIADLLCHDRESPLLLGSVKSNMGHCEAAAAMASLVKVLLAMDRGVIPANLHFKTPNPAIEALCDGRIKVVDRNTPWDGGYVAINSFGLGGSNAHAILESNRKRNRPPGANYTLLRLVVASSCTEEGVRQMLSHAHAHSNDAELHALLDVVHAQNVRGHSYRGYRLLNEPTVEEIVTFESRDYRPIWFVLSGTGSQWAGVGRSLLQLPVFAASVKRSAVALLSNGLDLIHILTDLSDEAFDVVTAQVSITAVQVALIDVLRAVDINPDGIIGHSVGEIACAYADGALTSEQAVQCAYWCGRSVLDANMAPGAMAAVGLSWEKCAERCPGDVELACHNAADSVTVAGPVNSVKEFVLELTASGVFAQLIDSAGVAFHSSHIIASEKLLRDNIQTIIPEPKTRTPRWVSASMPKDHQSAMLCNSAYYANTMVGQVRFADALRSIPPGAVVIELAPDAQLEPVLRRALPTATHVALLRRNTDTCQHLLAAIGKLYNAGCQPQISRLYPAVQWPVSCGTPGLAAHVRWDHSTEWMVANFASMPAKGENIIECDLSSSDDAFIAGHRVDGRTLYPATGYLYLVWKTMARLHYKKLEETAIVLENVRFKRATIVSNERSVRFSVHIMDGTGEFVVCEGGNAVVTGTVRLAESAYEMLELEEPETEENDKDLPSLSKHDVYKEFGLRGYHYHGLFRGILHSNLSGTSGTLAWKDNWISFMDTMLQMTLINSNSRNLYLPVQLQRAVIDPTAHMAALLTADGTLPVYQYPDIEVIKSGGIEFRGIMASPATRRAQRQAPPKLEKYVFVPYESNHVGSEISMWDALTICVQLVKEQVGVPMLRIAEAALGCAEDDLLLPKLLQILELEPQVQVESSLAAGPKAIEYMNILKDLEVVMRDKFDAVDEFHLVAGTDVLTRHGAGTLRGLVSALADKGLLLLNEPLGAIDDVIARKFINNSGLTVVMRKLVYDREFLLLRLRTKLPIENVVVEVGEDTTFEWMEDLRTALKRAETEDIRVYLFSRGQQSGLLGLALVLRLEPGGGALRVYHVPGACGAFTPDAPPYAAQAQLDLVSNVLQEGQWGCYRHLQLGDSSDDSKPLIKVKEAYVNMLARGDLSSLRWIESPMRLARYQPDVKDTEVCDVYYAPLNFRDIMRATGKLADDFVDEEVNLGVEFSGRTLSGKRVMGVLIDRGLATSVQPEETGILWEVPEQWTLEEASTIPAAYGTAYLAMVVRGRMQPSDSVLIHAGAGGVGMAAINIALHAGCTVFTTVGSAEKRSFIHTHFPDLPDSHIGNSRDASFEELVRRKTRGKGVNIVLNSLAGDLMQASIRCLAIGGRFLEIGKFDFANNTALGMSMFLKNTTFHGILLDIMMHMPQDDPERLATIQYLQEGIASGAVKPLPHTVFSDEDLEQAFRYMATGKHMGKVVLRVREEEPAGVAPITKLVSAVPRTYMNSSKSYILVGGLGGFGLEVAQWMVVRGATKLVFNSRSGIRTGYQAYCIKRWQKRGVQVVVSTADASKVEGAYALLQEANALGPVGGVFNLAVVLRDAYFENQTQDDFRYVGKPKVDVTTALDKVTRQLTPDLDYFVVFSSMVCGRGNPGQSNYGLANAVMERIVEKRQADGLAGQSIQWGAIGEVGLMVELMGDDIVVCGTLPQKISSCMQAFGTLLALPDAITVSMVLADKHRTIKANRKDLAHQIANVLGITDLKKVSKTASLLQLGIDSLMGAEIKQTLERSYDIVMSIQEIRDLTFTKIEEISENGKGNDVKKMDNMLMQYAQLKELVPTKVIVELPSLSASALPDTKPVFMVHPIEGLVNLLWPLASRVCGIAYGIQCAAHAPLDNMADLAQFYLAHLREIQPEPPYTILGYSFGASVAVEMALQLDQAGCETRLVLVEGSPSFMSDFAKNMPERMSGVGAASEAFLLSRFTHFFNDIDIDTLEAELKRLPNWESRLKRTAELIPGAAPHSLESIATAAFTLRKKAAICINHRPQGQLTSPVTLFTANESHLSRGKDHGLRALCLGPLYVRQLPGTHRSILAGDSGKIIADHVSKMLANSESLTCNIRSTGSV